MTLKILSWNIWGGKYLPEIIEFIKKSNPDIIALQEVVQDIDGRNNTAQIISEKFENPTSGVEMRLHLGIF